MPDFISIKGSRVHNLKNVSLELPRHTFIVFTGLSGSGKSSLAFDTIFAEGQRRYMESLSAYARQFLHQMDKPDVDSIEGLSPAISIDQKAAPHNPRSTVGTTTEIYDYLRLLFANIGKAFCTNCNLPIQNMSVQEVVDAIYQKAHVQYLVLSPQVKEKKGEHKDLLEQIRKDGFSRIRVNGEILKLQDPIKLNKNNKHTIEIVIDRLEVNEENRPRLFESVETALKFGNGLVKLSPIQDGEELLFSESMACPKCHITIEEISPRLFSFNSPVGACPDCNGLGNKLDFEPDLVVEFPDKPLRLCTGKIINLNNTQYGLWLNRSAKTHGFSLDTPYNDLTPVQRNIFLYGQETEVEDNPYMGQDYEDLFTGVRHAPWEGLINNLRRRYKQTSSEMMRYFFRGFMIAKVCGTCKGSRLKAAALLLRVGDKTISDVTQMSVDALLPFFETMTLSEKEQVIAHQILKEIRERLSFLQNVGLNYLSLDRQSTTLSGGEYQRIRLATQIGAGLSGVLYVLDEPSIGLHQRDNLKLIQSLKKLRDLGNTLIVVEHDEETIREADFVVDIGPGAGRHGGQVVFAGPVDKLLNSDTDGTAQYLNGNKQIEVPKIRRHFKKQAYITVAGARENNLKNLTVQFPLGKLICVTGVSGSGKSTLVNDILHLAIKRHFHEGKDKPGQHDKVEGLEHIDKMITIDQSPIGRTPRSNPATYTGLFGPIRELFAQSRDAKVRGYKPGRFSFNVKGGRCEACEGDGVKKIEMHFLPDVYVKCEVCKGKRYNDQTLEVKFKGYSIADILDMTVQDSLDVFENIPSIHTKLQTLMDVGLSYIQLGQNATTLSGGEAQRIKLAKELSKRSTGKTLYLLDEPTTGLHFADIEKLLHVLQRLVEGGNTLVVIEHNLDVIKTADHIIDLGPEGGPGGGTLVAEGTPEEVAKVKASYTGQFLAPMLTAGKVLG